MRKINTLLGADDTTFYLSFLVRPESTAGAGNFNNFMGLTLESPTEPKLFIGRGGPNSFYHVAVRGGIGRVHSDVMAIEDETALLVLKADFNSGNDTFTLFANPVLDGTEPTSGFVKDDVDLGQVTGLGIYYTGGFSVDEIRVGTTYASVVSVPEPSMTAVLAVFATATCLVRTRRRYRHGDIRHAVGVHALASDKRDGRLHAFSLAYWRRNLRIRCERSLGP